MPTRTVLIVDRELGFVFWLGQALDRAGYQALPAKSCEDAAELLKQLNVEIHLLIVGHSLEGAGAFADSLRRSQGHLKVIDVIGDGEEPGPEFLGSDAPQFMLSAVDECNWRQGINRSPGSVEIAACAECPPLARSISGNHPVPASCRSAMAASSVSSPSPMPGQCPARLP
jgi:hypothetical protein